MNQTPLVDYHCHLDLYRDHKNAYERARASRTEIFTMTTTPRAWHENLKQASGAPNIRIGIGLHPQIVGSLEADIDLFERLAPDARYIGEVGLDAGPRFYRNIEKQKELFRRILKICAQSGPKVISIHSVRSASLILPMLEEHLAGTGCRTVFHWFSGSFTEAKKVVGYGGLFSINAAMGNSESGRRLIRELPLGSMLTETDGPFTSVEQGVQFNPNGPEVACKVIADIKGLSVQHVIEHIYSNLTRFEQAFM